MIKYGHGKKNDEKRLAENNQREITILINTSPTGMSLFSYFSNSQTCQTDSWVAWRRESTKRNWCLEIYVQPVVCCTAQPQHRGNLRQKRYTSCFKRKYLSWLTQNGSSQLSLHLKQMMRRDRTLAIESSTLWQSRNHTSFQKLTSFLNSIQKPGFSQH